jgi:uncharacterized membrane protein YidH (DUF202 family)
MYSVKKSFKSAHIYLHANLTAQTAITKWDSVKEKKQNTQTEYKTTEIYINIIWIIVIIIIFY